MPRKGSRVLVIDDQSFRYRVRDTNADTISLAVEASEDSGAVLSVIVDFRDPYLHAHGKGLPDKPLMPEDVRIVVQKALELGWDPAKPGAAFKARLSQDGTFVVLQ